MAGAVTSPSGPRPGRGGQGQHWGSSACQLMCGGSCASSGTLPLQLRGPLCPATIFPSFISSTSSLSCLHSPNTHRLLSWVLSHPTHSLPLVSAPSQPQGPPHGAPCRPRLMGARWPPSDSATGLWEPRRPAFPCPHTQLTLPR